MPDHTDPVTRGARLRRTAESLLADVAAAGPAPTRLVQRGGEDPDLAVWGDAAPGDTPVLLVHGMGGDHATWRGFARTLTEAGRRVLAVDMRGHGRSGRAARYGLADFADDLAAVLDDLELPEIDVVAHSLGAHSVLRMASAQPERVRRLVVEEPPPMPRHDADLAEQIAPAFSGLGDRVRGFAALALRPQTFLLYDRSMNDEISDQFTRIDTQWWSGLSAVAAPTLVVSGGERSFLPPRHLRSVAQALPDGEFVTIDAGHSVHRDKPKEFLAAARSYLLD